MLGVCSNIFCVHAPTFFEVLSKSHASSYNLNSVFNELDFLVKSSEGAEFNDWEVSKISKK